MRVLSTIVLVFLLASKTFTQQVIDQFETLSGWKTIASDAVEIKISNAAGYSGKCIKIDFNFKAGTGYCGIEKQLPLKLPSNFRFTYYLRAEAPVNNLEFKLLDKSGDNVWWLNKRSFEFPSQWTKQTVKKRDIQFAWGPTEDQSLKETDKIEIFVASSTGGKGTLYIDELNFEKLEPLSKENPQPVVIQSSNEYENKYLLDEDNETQWHSLKTTDEEIKIDLIKHREYGGLVIDWDEKNYADKYDIQASSDNKRWETIYSVTNGTGGRRYIDLQNNESRYLRLKFLQGRKVNNYVIKDIHIKGYEFSENRNKFFSEIAKDKPKGLFPRYLYDEQSFWTITGVNNDPAEALFNTDGMTEVDKKCFSIEPFIYTDNELLSWNNTEKTQSLEDGYLPIPSVSRRKDGLILETKVFSSGEAGNSVLYIINKISNSGIAEKKGNLYLALRPFQVNPPWQVLNNPGGTAVVKSVAYNGKKIKINNARLVIPVSKPDGFGAGNFDAGEVIEYLEKDRLPPATEINDNYGAASGAIKYTFELKPNEEREYILAVPFYAEKYDSIESEGISSEFVSSELEKTKTFWKDKLNTAEFRLPSSGEKIVNVIKSNLAYILINRDNKGIQPGSRSYERSWIRDGALTSSALLKMGISEEVKDFISWYSSYQYENGKVPCVVDNRGPDPVPENDSNGELIFSIMQYYRFTKDTLFLRSRFNNVIRSVDYISYLIDQRKTDQYKDGNDSLKALYGLLPESISHEGYSSKPMHSYWDDFFGLLGLKCAVEIAEILNEKNHQGRFIKLRDEFKTNLYNSINYSIKNHNINYIPGAAELGDFDATSTAIAIYPCGEKKNLPEEYLKNTFDKYYEHFKNRLDPVFSWINYTPYEVRVIGTFVYLDQIERAHRLTEFFLSDQFPKAWNHWAEVVWRNPQEPKFIGDMPHTWVGSDFISAARAMFVYEDEYENSLVLGAGLYKEWLDSSEGIEVKNLPTYYGSLSYTAKKEKDKVLFNITGDIKLPEGGIRVKNRSGLMPYEVKINGRKVEYYGRDEIRINEFPALIECTVK